MDVLHIYTKHTKQIRGTADHKGGQGGHNYGNKFIHTKQIRGADDHKEGITKRALRGAADDKGGTSLGH